MPEGYEFERQGSSSSHAKEINSLSTGSGAFPRVAKISQSFSFAHGQFVLLAGWLPSGEPQTRRTAVASIPAPSPTLIRTSRSLALYLPSRPYELSSSLSIYHFLHLYYIYIYITIRTGADSRLSLRSPERNLRAPSSRLSLHRFSALTFQRTPVILRLDSI